MANEHPSAYDDFQKFGHTGEYTTVWSVAGDTAEYFTGSKYGAGAVLREGGWDGIFYYLTVDQFQDLH